MSADARGDAPPRRPLVLFDLDGTLLDGDTDELWCAFLIDEGVLDRTTFEPANRDVADRYARGAITPAEFCDFYAATLGGRTAQAWAERRARFVAERIAPRIGEAARALVDRHAGDGAQVVMTTATNRFLTEPIAALFGIDGGSLIATELEQAADGAFTGRTTGVLNMQGGKVARLRAWLARPHPMPASATADDAIAATLAGATFYSDSRNDLPLLGAVGRPVAVDPDPLLEAEATRRGWPIVRLPRPPRAPAGH